MLLFLSFLFRLFENFTVTLENKREYGVLKHKRHSFYLFFREKLKILKQEMNSEEIEKKY